MGRIHPLFIPSDELQSEGKSAKNSNGAAVNNFLTTKDKDDFLLESESEESAAHRQLPTGRIRIGQKSTGIDCRQPISVKYIGPKIFRNDIGGTNLRFEEARDDALKTAKVPVEHLWSLAGNRENLVARERVELSTCGL